MPTKAKPDDPIVVPPMVLRPDRCGTCKFYEKKTRTVGVCHAEPPTSGAAMNFNKCVWPPCAHDDWCGHWEAIEPPA